jgi:hypothetical protein
VSARLESFYWRIENPLLREGGFALVHGEPGSGKSVAMRVIAHRTVRLPDMRLGTISHPQCNLAEAHHQPAPCDGTISRAGTTYPELARRTTTDTLAALSVGCPAP